ncbi:hypothetical protein [Staphylococcus aureus]|uniref:hypothetical protein n=1 Tax=Staphylococcus aureus TaxID=1280 RepID=UPI003D1F3892
MTITAAVFENVLREYSLRVANTQGQTFADMADELFRDLTDDGRAALQKDACSRMSRTGGADRAEFDAVTHYLIGLGTLEF